MLDVGQQGGVWGESEKGIGWCCDLPWEAEYPLYIRDAWDLCTERYSEVRKLYPVRHWLESHVPRKFVAPREKSLIAES